MTKRPPPKGRGADIFLGENGDRRRPTSKPRAKGRGADVFLEAEPGKPRPRRRPPSPETAPPAPDRLAAGLDELARSWAPPAGGLDRSHVMVMLWLQVALKGDVKRKS
jgi:hypothetical protein